MLIDIYLVRIYLIKCKICKLIAITYKKRLAIDTRPTNLFSMPSRIDLCKS